MPKLLKIVGLFLAAVVVLLVVVAVALPLFVNPNDFKPRIEAAVEEATGRNLEIVGDIDLSVFPWLGVDLGTVRLGNAEGFGDEPFASVEGVQVRVKLLPLLTRNIEIGKVVVEQPLIHLQRNAEGRANWDDLAGEPAQEEEEAAPQEDAVPPDFSVDGVEIRSARIRYADAAAGLEAELNEFNLTTGELGLPADFPLSMQGNFTVSDPAVTGSFTFEGQVAANAETEVYVLGGSRLSVKANGKGLPVSPLDASVEWQRIAADMGAGTANVEGLAADVVGVNVTADVDASAINDAPQASGRVSVTADDLAAVASRLGELLPEGVALDGAANINAAFSYDKAAGTAELPELSAQVLGIDVSAHATATNLNETARVVGRLETGEFSPGRLLVKLGQELPATRDGNVLERAAVQADFQATPNSAAIENLVLLLDQSKLTGGIEVADIERQALRFDLALDQIDADRYLPPASEQAAEETGEQAPLDQVEIPAELVRGLDIAGQLAIGKLKAFGFNSTDVKIGVNAANDVLRLNPLQASFYDGGYRGDMRVDASGEVPSISVDEHVERVQLAPLVRDVLEVENVSGTAKMDVTANARGKTFGDLRKTLSGNFAVDVQDGAIEGFNLWESIREAYATLKGRQHDAGNAPERTEFAELSATGMIDKGVIRNDDLNAKLPFLRVTGKGTIDIAAATLDYGIETQVLKSPELTGGIEELTGTTIPVRITGSLTDPKVRPDVKGVLEQKAKEALERKEQELRDKAKEKAEEEKKRLEDKLKDKLKGLFGG